MPITRRALVANVGRSTLGALLFAATALVTTGCLHTRGPSLPLAATAPDFTLKSHEGKDVSLAALLKEGPAVIVFYRGYW